MQVSYKSLMDEVSSCNNCKLSQNRTNTVFGEGDIHCDIMLVGEGPGANEDKMGRPFVGQAGMLLDKMLLSIGIKRESVYICNIVKCRPPGNRVPTEDEAFACLPYLRGQYALIKPKIVICLGATAAKYLIDPNIRITRDRGQFYEKKGTFFIATYHPAALLRDQSKKYEAWEDLKLIKEKIKELNIVF